MPFFSIIVPVYNVEQYLRCCLDSVLSQTFINIECILVDDGSPDDCPAICDEYARKDSRFKVIHKENGGLSDARNVGIRAAIGDYIVLLDSDDLFVDNMALENLCRAIEETKADVIFSSCLTVSTSETVTSSDDFKKEIICEDTIPFFLEIISNRKILLAGCRFIIQRNFLFNNDLFFKVGILYEDQHWIPRLICAASKIGINHSPFYMYRRERPGSIMAIMSPKRAFDGITIIEDMLNSLKTENGKSYKCQKIYKSFCCYTWNSILYEISLIVKLYKEDSFVLLKKLKNVSFVLLYRISLYNVVCYFLIHFINGNIKRYMFFAKIYKLVKK